MTKQAHLPDGTVLEFPDDTPDAVMDKVVKSHLSPTPAKPAPISNPKEPGAVESAFVGALHGLADTGLGLQQFQAHATPVGLLNDYLSKKINGASSNERLDNYIRSADADYAKRPGSDSFAGKGGEFVGGVLATAPVAALAMPAKGASLLSALYRAAAGGAAMSATQPVAGDNFAAQKAQQMATGAVLSPAIVAGGRGAMSLAERTFAPNAMAQMSNLFSRGANRSQFAQEGEQLAARTGIPMTPGQVSGSRVQTALENMSRQSVFSADTALAADQRIAQGAMAHVNRLMDNISRNPASEASVGAQIQTATRGAITKIADQRDKVAAAQYGAIDAAIGNRPFVQPHAAMKAADDIIVEFQHVATPEAERIVSQAQALKAKLAAKQGYTFKEAQLSRAYYGKAAKGGASVFDEVSHDLNRRLATKIYAAMSSDIENSAAGLSGRGPGLAKAGTVGLQDAIKQANDNYRRYSQLLTATESHPIARLFGDRINVDDVMVFDKIPPETVINRLGQMKPTELHMVREFMDRNAPEAWQQYKRLLVDKALSEAQNLPTSRGGNVVPFNSAQFVRALGGDKHAKIEQLKAVFSPREYAEIDDAFSAARRMGDRFGYNGSGTGPYMEVQNFLQSIKSRSVAAAASTGGEILGLRKIANVMLNADGRRALIQLSRLPPKSRQAASLVASLAALSSGQGVVNPGADQNANKQESSPGNPGQ